jgi:hypothetical protein
MKALCTAILSGGIWGSGKVFNACVVTPFAHGHGKKFTVVGDNDLESFAAMEFNRLTPGH